MKWTGGPSHGYQSTFLFSHPGHHHVDSKGTMVAGIKFTCGTSNMGFYSPWPAWPWPHLSAQSASRDRQGVLDSVLFIEVISQLPGDRLITLDNFPLWKGQCFVLTRIDTNSRYQFCFPADSVSAKTIICGVTRLLIYCSSYFNRK